MLKRSAPPALVRAQARDRRLRRRLIRQGVIVPPGSRQATSLVNSRPAQSAHMVPPSQLAPPLGGIGGHPDVHRLPNHGPEVNRRGYYVDNVLPAIISTASENAES